MLTFERQLWTRGCRRLAGMDEAGCGPLAGPVVAAAVVCAPDVLEFEFSRRLAELTDSKQLTARQRRLFFNILETLRKEDRIEIGVGIAEAAEIDRHNIRAATHMAMRRALLNLPRLPEHVLVDGLPAPGLPCPSTAIVKGDSLSLSIAAASVMAKVTRDDIMNELDSAHPEYGFAQHKGYGTEAHIQALLQHGSIPQHRRSFRPVHEIEAIRAKAARQNEGEYVAKTAKHTGRAAARRATRQTLPGFMG